PRRMEPFIGVASLQYEFRLRHIARSTVAYTLPRVLRLLELFTRVKRFIDGVLMRSYNRGVRRGGGAGSAPYARGPTGRAPGGQIGVGAASSAPFDPHRGAMNRILNGRYRIDGVVGDGGMAVVYRGWDIVL